MTRHVLRHLAAKPTTVKCPRCGDILVINGNVFCNSMDAIEYDKEIRDVVIVKGTCSWALGHPAVSKEDQAVVGELYRLGYYSTLDYG